jgi:predicted NBD/HSP70 family sugar kinase
MAACFGATHGYVAVLDLAGRPLFEERADVAVADGPQSVLDWLGKRFLAHLIETGRDPTEVRGIGLGLPGQVEFATGRVLQPAIMPGWHDYPVVEHLQRFLDVPVLVDNDVKLMALGEHTTHLPECPILVLVKVATGIGAGVVINGVVQRGVDGIAGAIGHIRLRGYDTPCPCGGNGCLHAVASGTAVAARLSALGTPAATSRELLTHITAGHPDACCLAREAGQLLGEVLATVACLINPEHSSADVGACRFGRAV